jgi:plastocyanin
VRKPLLALAACVLALTAWGEGPDQSADTSHSDPNSSAPAASTTSAPSSAPEAEADPVVFTVAGGSRTEGPDTVEVGVGDRVLLEVTSDVADEVHVHGYDETVEVTPAAPARVEFVAEIPGSFEVEMHEQGLLLTQLRVGG